MALTHLKGLNTLRFFAAALVLFDHARHHLNEMGINFGENLPFLHKGITAVNFFFTLSGFLISYLAINEINKLGKIDFKFFYIRRVLRIFPLYYLVFFIMICLIGVLVPMLMHENKLGFPMLQGGLLYTLMLPNMVKAIWPDTAGGLNILWSIGVEEQFYVLFPLVVILIKNESRRLVRIISLTLIYFAIYWLLKINVLGLSLSAITFFATLKFHYMLVGIVFAVLCHKYFYDKEWLIKKYINNTVFQGVLFCLILLVFTMNFNEFILTDLCISVLFALLIVTISHREKGIINYNVKALSYFGVISYGIYLLHPLVSYFLRFFIVKFEFVANIIDRFPVLYLVTLLIATLSIAHVSYQFYEKQFLKLKKRYQK